MTLMGLINLQSVQPIQYLVGDLLPGADNKKGGLRPSEWADNAISVIVDNREFMGNMTKRYAKQAHFLSLTHPL